MIRDWLSAAATGAQFLTRLPVPGGANADPARFPRDIARALVLFPLLGALIGALSASALLLGGALWPLPVAVLLALAVEARITGALHEDAVADLCDALGGGRTPEEVLRILKDSRIGAFGTLGLVLAVALRAAGLMVQPEAWRAAVVLVVSGCLGRLLMLAVLAAVPTVPGRPGLASAVGPAAGWRRVALAAVVAAPALALGVAVDARGMAVAVLGGALFLLWYAALLRRRIGGVTGDAAGAAAYAGILIATLAFALRP